MEEKMQNGASCENGEMEFQEIQIPVPWGHIAGKWWGDRKQLPVIALHGWQDNCGTFDTLAPLIYKKIPLLCIDLPGHGFSSPYPVGQYYYLFWDGIHVLRRIVKHFGFEKIKLLGHSLGGAISFLYAASYPDEVLGYVSLDIASPSVRDPEKLVSAIGDHTDKFLKYEKLNLETFGGYSYQECLDIALDGYRGSVTENSSRVLLKRGIKATADSDQKFLFTRDPRLKVPALGFISFEQVEIFASKIKCPVLNIRANPGMKFYHEEHYKLILDKIEKNAPLERVTVPGTHHVHLNEPEKIYQKIMEFFEK